MHPRLVARGVLPALALCACLVPASGGVRAAEAPLLLGLGDSIGAGVQSADANLLTQPASYLNLIARQMSVPFPLPWVTTGPLASVGSVANRERIVPSLAGANLAVSGASTDSLLNQPADAASEAEIDSETDLMLFPRLGSQMEIAEAAAPAMIISWIGSNDVLSAVLSFDQLDASQMTPVVDFAADFAEIVQRLDAAAPIVVLGNIPDVTRIGFLVDRQDLIDFLGSDFGLPDGHYTSIVAMFLIQLGLGGGILLQIPDFVLDPGEIAAIRQRTDELNQVIDQEAAAAGIPVVDVHAAFADFAETPPVLGGITLTLRFLGGLFSLDGVHPSNSAHALLANAFIETINAGYGLGVPEIGPADLGLTALTDPFVDKDGDGVVTGRPFAGLLETLGPFLGISGDPDDLDPGITRSPSESDPQLGPALLARLAGVRPDADGNLPPLTRDDAVRAFKRIFRMPPEGP